MQQPTIKLFGALLTAALSIVSVSAAGTDTWVGNTDANWTTAANWTTSGGSTPPANGDSLVFGAAGSAGASLNNDISGLSVLNFNINSGASAFTFGGNGFTLNSTLTDVANVNETFSGGITIGSNVATAIKNTGSGTLALGALSQASGGTVDFTTNGPITTTTANTSGILGGWATTGNNVSSATTGDWAANDGSGNIVAYTGYTVGTVIAGQPATANFKNTANATMTASTTINSLSQWADVTLSGGQTLTLNSGGLVLGGISRWLKNANANTGSAEYLKSGLATGELFVHVPDADANANNWTIWPIVADNLTATALIKDGPGLVKLGNYNTYTGGTFVNGGTLQLGNGVGGGGTGFLRGVVTVNSGATLNLSRVDAIGYNSGVCVDTINVNGGTVANTSGGNEGFLTGLNLTGGTVTSTGGNYVFQSGYGNITSLASPLTSLISAPLWFWGAGSFAVAQGNTASGNDLIVSGAIKSSTGVSKTGPGKLVMTGANTYTGDTYITEGVLQLGDGASASGSLAGNIDNETTLIIANPGAVTLPGVIYSSSAAPLIKTGAGTLTLSGAN
ncbi:MAG TPA: autotransporter-associated beta strand repeat-containing protein, partial [bacterium]|nr:autotransporter-associated beta strand repeat-containing protein [bacterium]